MMKLQNEIAAILNVDQNNKAIHQFHFSFGLHSV